MARSTFQRFALSGGPGFDLNIITVQNTGDLLTMEADRTAPLSGEFKFRIKVGSAQTDLDKLRLIQPGEICEFYGLRWTHTRAATRPSPCPGDCNRNGKLTAGELPA